MTGPLDVMKMTREARMINHGVEITNHGVKIANHGARVANHRVRTHGTGRKIRGKMKPETREKKMENHLMILVVI